MDHLELFRKLNLWDIPVIEVKLGRDRDGEFNVEAKLQVPKCLIPDAISDVPARLIFKNCDEFMADIDVALWSRVGPEFGDQTATVISTNPLRVRYVLGLRESGSTVEVVAESFLYEGPDIFQVGDGRPRPRGPRVRDILGQ